jgi:small nuclear ribonucleoprotein (snRNP)-like protein
MLADGRKIRGTVQEFDRDQVTIEEAGGPVVIRKTEIRYLYEQG